MNIVIVGTGYVGLVSGTCLAESGHTVHCLDIDTKKIEKLNNNIIPIYEPGLDELIAKNVLNNRLFFTSDYNVVSNADVIFIAVGTPPGEDGSADLTYVLSVAHEVGFRANKRFVIVDKSTVPVGTGEKVKNAVQEELNKRGADIEFHVCSNPEFLKEGSAINDFINPDKIVLGVEDEFTEIVMTSVYKNFDQSKILITDIKSAEMIKYAANSMLATRISFMNDIANLCEIVGANVDLVSKGIGMDQRIGSKFLNAGCGYGGSCFPKDVKALIKTANQNNYIMKVLNAVEEVNENQKHKLYHKLYNLKDLFEEQPIKKIAILGIAFKPNTDDTREAPSFYLLNDIIDDKLNLCNDALIYMYDPIAIKNCKSLENNRRITLTDNIDECIMDADVTFICTEWDDIKNMSLPVFKRLANQPIIIDGRNCINKENAKTNEILYVGIGI